MKKLLFSAAMIALSGVAQLTPAFADPVPADWPAVTAEARGQTVYWNAWGGST
ncbi:MAG: putative thiamine transport system substrate-binding protein, partial [Paracoccaceae bacterium]